MKRRQNTYLFHVICTTSFSMSSARPFSRGSAIMVSLFLKCKHKIVLFTNFSSYSILAICKFLCSTTFLTQLQIALTKTLHDRNQFEFDFNSLLPFVCTFSATNKTNCSNCWHFFLANHNLVVTLSQACLSYHFKSIITLSSLCLLFIWCFSKALERWCLHHCLTEWHHRIGYLDFYKRNIENKF